MVAYSHFEYERTAQSVSSQLNLKFSCVVPCIGDKGSTNSFLLPISIRLSPPTLPWMNRIGGPPSENLPHQRRHGFFFLKRHVTDETQPFFYSLFFNPRLIDRFLVLSQSTLRRALSSQCLEEVGEDILPVSTVESYRRWLCGLWVFIYLFWSLDFDIFFFFFSGLALWMEMRDVSFQSGRTRQWFWTRMQLTGEKIESSDTDTVWVRRLTLMILPLYPSRPVLSPTLKIETQ